MNLPEHAALAADDLRAMLDEPLGVLPIHDDIGISDAPESPASKRRMRNLDTDRYLVAVSGTQTRTTHESESAARSIAEGMAKWSEHLGKQVTVTDREAPPREVPSIFGGTRLDTKPVVICHFTARRVA